MRIAINKDTTVKHWIPHKKYNEHLFDDLKWLELHDFSKEPWECPFCGCDMVLKAFDRFNIPTPHWAAKNSHEIDCEVFERVLEGDYNVKINFLIGIINTPREKYIDRLLMRLEDFDKEIYEGAIFAIAPEDIRVWRTDEFRGINYADINIGDPFKKGVSIKLRESELPKEGEDLIMCFGNIRRKDGISQWGKPYVKKTAYKNDFRYFKRKNKEVLND